MNIGPRLRYAIAEREILYKIASGEIIFKMMLIIIGYLQKLNEIREKRLLEAHERTEIRMLVKKIRLWNWIDFHCFDHAYKLFVERKRRKMFEEINAIEDEIHECWLRRQRGESLREIYPIEKRKKQTVLETYYAFLKDDDAYKQKAFLEFLKKKVEDGDGRQEISAYLEEKCQKESYAEYERLTAWSDSQLVIELPELWIEFFRSGTEYATLIPDERPNVAYSSDTCAEIPRFVFEKPFVEEFTEQVFIDKFTKEWNTTHYYPDDECDDPIYRQECDMDLDQALWEAYDEYISAVSMAKRNQQMFGLFDHSV